MQPIGRSYKKLSMPEKERRKNNDSCKKTKSPSFEAIHSVHSNDELGLTALFTLAHISSIHLNAAVSIWLFNECFSIMPETDIAEMVEKAETIWIEYFCSFP